MEGWDGAGEADGAHGVIGRLAIDGPEDDKSANRIQEMGGATHSTCWRRRPRLKSLTDLTSANSSLVNQEMRIGIAVEDGEGPKKKKA